MKKIMVIPTDTLYGLVGSALDKNVVEKIYQIKGRTPSKPFIILISSLEDLKKFGIVINEGARKFLDSVWPGPVSVILPCPNTKFEYLHRGTNALAFRIPDKQDLVDLLKQTGPLVAPSANPEGEKPASTIEEAKEYFGDKVDEYIDGGELRGEPSTLVEVTSAPSFLAGSKIKNVQVKILRQGSYKL